MDHKLSLGLNPVPAARPRVSKWGTYYPKNYTDYKKRAKEKVSGAWGDCPLEGHLSVSVDFFAARPKTTKLDVPKPDIDNYIKAIFDACNGLVWRDDTQVVEVSARKHWAEPGEEGRTVLRIERV